MPRRAAPPKTLYYIEYTCRHYDTTSCFSLTKRKCPTCLEHLPTREPGAPDRVTRYMPKLRPSK